MRAPRARADRIPAGTRGRLLFARCAHRFGLWQTWQNVNASSHLSRSEGGLPINHWIYKIAVLLLTPFLETVYLDADIMVVSPNLLDDLLSRSLRIADIAFPVDPARQPNEYPAYHREKEFARGIPPMCAGLMAYRLNASGCSGLPTAAETCKNFSVAWMHTV